MLFNLITMFSRGSEVGFHGLEMLRVAFLRVLVITFFAGFGFAALLTWWHLGYEQSQVVTDLIRWRFRTLLESDATLHLSPPIGDGRTEFYALRFMLFCSFVTLPIVSILASVVLILQGIALYGSILKRGKTLIDLSTHSAYKPVPISILGRQIKQSLIFCVLATVTVFLFAGHYRTLLPLHIYFGLSTLYPKMLWFAEGVQDYAGFIWLDCPPFGAGWYRIERVQAILNNQLGPQRLYILVWLTSFGLLSSLPPLKHHLRRRYETKESPDYKLAQLSVPAHKMHLPSIICGSAGSGRKTALMAILDRAKERGDKAIIYESGNELLKRYYKKNNDILFSPTDQRSVPWSIWAEASHMRELSEVADSLFPRGTLSGQDRFIQECAARLFVEVAHHLAHEQKNSQLVEWLSGAKKGSELYELLNEGTKHRSSLGILNNESSSMRVLSLTSNALHSFSFLPDISPEAPHTSIRQYILSDSSSRWAFISSSSDYGRTFRPLVSMWCDIFARNLLKLPPAHHQAHWLVLDGLESLQRLPTIHLLLKQGWAHNIRVVIVLSHMKELEGCYGAIDSPRLILQAKNWVIFRCEDPVLAKSAEQHLGEEVVREADETYTMGVVTSRDSVRVKYREIRRPIVPSSVLQTLEDERCYIALEGSEEIYRVKFAPSNLQQNSLSIR